VAHRGKPKPCSFHFRAVMTVRGYGDVSGARTEFETNLRGMDKDHGQSPVVAIRTRFCIDGEFPGYCMPRRGGPDSIMRRRSVVITNCDVCNSQATTGTPEFPFVPTLGDRSRTSFAYRSSCLISAECDSFGSVLCASAIEKQMG